MITIKFENWETEKRALAFLLGRFSGRVLKTGEHLVPEAALEALASQNISFTVETTAHKLAQADVQFAQGEYRSLDKGGIPALFEEIKSRGDQRIIERQK